MRMERACKHTNAPIPLYLSTKYTALLVQYMAQKKPVVRYETAAEPSQLQFQFPALPLLNFT